MWLRPETQLSVWLRSTFCWLAALTITMVLDAIHDDLILLFLPVIGSLLLLPLAFVGTWASESREVPLWSFGRIVLHWLVMFGANWTLIVLLGLSNHDGDLVVLLASAQGVALVLLTGLWIGRRGAWKALPAGRA